uniref:Niban apoptosis regulator 2 n=1 Tax=Malurus cyaneus samueli TaxID=2593467 RepID=A0A8C5UJ55_9PASS
MGDRGRSGWVLRGFRPQTHSLKRTGKVLGEFCRCYREQFGVALFNSVRYEIEGAGGPQAQLLHRKVRADHVIYSGNIFQYIEENKKWRNRFCVVPHNYGLVLYENKLAYEREMPPRVLVNSAGYKILTSVEQYLELVNNSLPGVTPKSGQSPILKCPTDFPLILWHPYARHYYFCVMTGKEQDKWRAVFQDCVRHCNNGCGEGSCQGRGMAQQVLQVRVGDSAGVGGVSEHPLCPQVSDAVYRMVYELAKAQYDAVVASCEQERPQLESTIRTDMDQVITSKEHLASKIRAFVLPKAEVCVRNHVQPYISSILEALMTPTSQGFAEVREVFFKEVTDMNMNVVNEGGLEKLPEYMEKLSHLAFHPVKMQSCYEKMDHTSVFKQRAQIHMRQVGWAPGPCPTLLHQELGKLQGKDELCKSIQRILERVLKKFDYDKQHREEEIFREACCRSPSLPAEKLAPTCKGFQELIFEDFEVVLQSVKKESSVKEAAGTNTTCTGTAMVMHNSDPTCTAGRGPAIDWSEECSGQPEASRPPTGAAGPSRWCRHPETRGPALRVAAEARCCSRLSRAAGAAARGAASPWMRLREIREALAQESPEDGGSW